ncbi:MAG: DEAD/DEAH box helicase [Methylomonas sp.]|jgi:ATP-dependent RNA helicase RhlE|uniref:DEAD/DEAH box helicase n=1 Tax=Methylomonas sp. TaxID=418 RepID=UPI0025D80142|nr:DEAD/DEAH box helicase [Methylomonas sp.]MCK9605153.1 DEAD/DEAH box helicase [Methylomonas sp.]
MLFSELALSEQLLQAVAEQGYQTPTPIQAQAIPVILQGRDVLAGAQTGTGKTAGFTLPLLQILQQQSMPQKPRPVRVLILTPTRELAMQVYESVRTYGKHLPFFAEAIFGGVSINPQIQKIQRGTDIVIATPGRLLDLIHQQHLSLSQVQHFVLDEADRMLDMGFIRDIRKIIALLPAKRQNLLFSATYAPEISALAEQILNDPVEIAVARKNAAADTVSQLVYPIKREYKRELLSYLIGNGDWQQVLVFVRTKHGADRLAKQLIKDGIRCSALHGDKSQGARVRALEEFKAGKITALIATDIAARGLDIEQLPHVVNFDLPQVAEDYVHRIGRTGRAGADGQAISLVDQEEAYLLAAIEKLLKKTIPQVADTGYEKVSLTVTDSKPKSSEKNTTSPKQNQTKRRPADKRRPGVAGQNKPSGGGGKSRSRG